MIQSVGTQNYFLLLMFLIPTLGLTYLIFANFLQTRRANSDQRQLIDSELSENLKDPITGLPNREASKKYFDMQKQNQVPLLAIIIVDIDNFRMINDTQGYSKGDEVLKRFAVYLKNKCKSETHIARLGGDEFVIIARGLNHNEALDFSREISDYIKSKDSSITVLDDSKSREYTNLTLSAGISCFPDDGDNYHALVKHADSAMMNVKRQGKNGIKRYQLSEESHLQYQQVLSRDLDRALDKGQFSLHYQPIYNTQNLLLTKAEALLRWNHPLYGSVPPSNFIEIAERNGKFIKSDSG